jgi:hypothetical protein
MMTSDERKLLMRVATFSLDYLSPNEKSVTRYLMARAGAKGCRAQLLIAPSECDFAGYCAFPPTCMVGKTSP